MPTITITGASDDLVCIDGEFTEEFHHLVDVAYLAVSDGTLLRIVFDPDGIWRITPVRRGSAAFDHLFGQDDRQHSDRVTLVGDAVHWVVYGSKWASRP